MATPPTRFGFTLPQRGALFGVTTVPRMLAAAAAVDRHDLFDSLWVGDSLMSKPRPDAVALLGALAAVTRRVSLGVGCMATFPVRDPIVFAYQWATLDLMSEGRMLLAACTGIVGGGASAREGAPFGVTDRERGARLEENIAICRRLWSGEAVSFQGTFRSFSDVSIRPQPIQLPCPIWIASNPRPAALAPAMFERALRRVARLADGWMTVQLAPGMLAGSWSRIRTYLEAEGRRPQDFPTMAYHNINIGPSRQGALEESKRFLDAYYGPVFSPSMVEAWTAAGSPAECVEHLRALRRDGAKTITLRITSWDQEAQFKRMVDEVLPEV
jgi:alkanesulfonate monooxygenase SsuD/methylene tetrahydromethanopterin reductase-like flavin-dependent oxidoreductase (luciferase family)